MLIIHFFSVGEDIESRACKQILSGGLSSTGYTRSWEPMRNHGRRKLFGNPILCLKILSAQNSSTCVCTEDVNECQLQVNAEGCMFSFLIHVITSHSLKYTKGENMRPPLLILNQNWQFIYSYIFYDWILKYFVLEHQ